MQFDIIAAICDKDTIIAISSPHRRDIAIGSPLAVDVAADPLFIFLQQIDGFRAAVGVMVAELDASAVHLGVLGQNAHGRLHSDVRPESSFGWYR